MKTNKNLFRKDHQSAFWAWFCFSLGVVAIGWFFSGCAHSQPGVDLSLWAGDSAQARVSRNQDNETISCTDIKFDSLVCMTYSDLQKLYAAFLQCD